MVRYGVFNYTKKWIIGLIRTNGVSLEQLNHQASKTFECSREAYGGIYVDKNTLCCVYVNLQFTGFVDG
jgi:hypothetical protein